MKTRIYLAIVATIGLNGLSDPGTKVFALEPAQEAKESNRTYALTKMARHVVNQRQVLRDFPR